MNGEFGLGLQGFKRKRYADIMESMETRARNLFGESINLGPASPLGIILRIVAWSLGLAWQVAEAVYHSAYADTATGNDLDKVAKYIGITRHPARRAAGEVIVTGTAGTVVPLDLLVATVDELAFRTVEEATIGPTNQVAVAVEAIEPGISGNVPPNTITEIVTPYPGIESVINPDPMTGGQERETDAEFRQRYTQSVATAGASTSDSIRATLLQVPGVRAALVHENTTMDTSLEGLPPKSIGCYVLGGDDPDVGHAILRTKAAGIQAYGTTEITVTDAAGQPHVIGFTRATEVDIEVSVTLTTDDRFPPDGLDLVRLAIIRYIGGEDVSGQVYAGLQLGQDVVYTRVIASIYEVPGVRDAAVTVNRAGEPPGTVNVSIGTTEVAETDHTLVAVALAGGP